MKDLEEQKIIRQYLLGELGEAEREGFEERVLTDPEYTERVLMAEDELIEDFVAEELSGGERERFVRHFLTAPQQLQRVELAKAVHAYFARRAAAATPSPSGDEPARAPFWKRRAAVTRRGWRDIFSAGAVAALAVMIVSVVGLLAWSYLRDQPGEQQAALRQKLSRLNDPQHLDQELLRNSPVFRVNLTGDFVRSVEGMSRATVPAEAKVVQLELPPAGYRSYRATLRTIEGEEIFTLPSLAASAADGNRRLAINVPTELLPRGDYELNLIGVGDNGLPSDAVAYYFRIAR